MLEAEIKKTLEQYLSRKGPLTQGSRILEEVSVSGGAARADLVNVSELHCYEIKSEKDSLKRLVSQGSKYMRVFNHVTLVTAKRHLEQALEIIPLSWGIILIPDRKGAEFIEWRKADRNNKQEHTHVSSLLAKEECLNVLSLLGLEKGKKSQSLYQLQLFIAENFSLNQITDMVKSALEMRRDFRAGI